MARTIFEIENSTVKINTNCLLIPELKEVFESYDDPIPAFCFLHYMTDYKSPYNSLPTIEKEFAVIADYPGDYTTEDPCIQKALAKLEILNVTPTRRLVDAARKGLDNLSMYIGTASISEGRDGNMAPFISALKSIAKINQEFKLLEKQADEENEIKGRGNADWSYDEFDNED